MPMRPSMGGFPVLELTVDEFKVHGAAALKAPALVCAFIEHMASEKAAQGVWLLAGGPPNGVAIAMNNPVMVVRGPRTMAAHWRC